jgi:hypothetical protein
MMNPAHAAVTGARIISARRFFLKSILVISVAGKPTVSMTNAKIDAFWKHVACISLHYRAIF